MTPSRALLIAMIAVALLIKAPPPIAGDEQFPRGLMSSAPRTSSRFCTIETRPLDFGVYDALAETAVDAIAQVIYICGGGDDGGGGRGGGGGGRGGGGGGSGGGGGAQSIRIEMDQGLGTSTKERQMTSGAFDTLLYDIYLDATHHTVWGDGSRGTDYYTNSSPPNGTPVTVPAFGRIFRGQDVMAGQYVDSVGVRIQF